MEAEVLDYLRQIRPRVASTTYVRKHWQIRSFCKYLAAKRKNFTEVKQADVEDYLGGLKCSQAFRQAICGVVREFYDFLRLRDPLAFPEQNPAAAIAFKPDTSERLFKVPSQSSVDALLARLSDANTELSLRNKLMAELAYGSGLRRMELARMNIEDIDFENGTAHVLGKGDKARIVPITEKTQHTIREYLSHRRAARGPLFTAFTGRRMGATSIAWAFQKKIGTHPHALRHACATHMLAGGCNVRLIQELLGHKRLNTTYIYTAVEKGKLREVIGRAHPRTNTCAMEKKS
jgi:integrase/recombinase XerC